MSLKSRSLETTRHEATQNESMNQYRDTENTNPLELKVHQLEREFSHLKQKTNQAETKNQKYFI